MPLVPFKLKEEVKAEPPKNTLVADVTERVVNEMRLLIPAPIKGDKGEPGKDGKTPTKQELISLIKPLIPKPIAGKDGRDGIDGKDGKDGESAELDSKAIEDTIKELLQPHLLKLAREASRVKQGASSSAGGGGDTLPSQSITSSVTMSISSKIILADASSNAITVTLPSASQVPRKEFHIKKTDSSSNFVTISPPGSETIDGQTAYIITNAYTSRRVYSDGNNYYII